MKKWKVGLIALVVIFSMSMFIGCGSTTVDEEFLHGQRPGLLNIPSGSRVWTLSDINGETAAGGITFHVLVGVGWYETTGAVTAHIPNTGMDWELNDAGNAITFSGLMLDAPLTVTAARDGNNLILTAGTAVLTFTRA